MRRLLIALLLLVGPVMAPTACAAAPDVAPAGSAVASANAAAPVRSIPDTPPAPREFRGAWVASVNNANWPSEPGLPVEQQKQEMLAILDYAKQTNLNAIVFQVRPCGDALYQSKLEPWSQYLTGVQGQPPSPMYDPLALWIEEAHKRGLELHAWFNPYRIKHADSKANLAPTSLARTQPQVVRQYGGYLWADPGEPVAARHSLAVILDIVRRYDIDGIHTDDYYYPYKIKQGDKVVDFPDNSSYQRYQRGAGGGGGKLARADWRRDNVNQLIQRIYIDTKKIKPWVKVSYAPFGIWKNGVPAGTKGLSQYDELYADAKLWLNEGWLDYISPQLYWKIGGDQDYDALLKWWTSESTRRRPVWPGMSVSRHPVNEVLSQIDLARQNGTSRGVMFWSFDSVRNHKGNLTDALLTGPYREAALIPAMPWLDNTPPPAPRVTAQRMQREALNVALQAGAGEPTARYAVWARYGERWRFVVVPGGAPSLTLNPDASGQPATAVVVTAVDRCGNESERVAPQIP
ncbi:MAG: family 10 glycosylhydrolase [Tepidisphaeraceae bacterium]